MKENVIKRKSDLCPKWTNPSLSPSRHIQVCVGGTAEAANQRSASQEDAKTQIQSLFVLLFVRSAACDLILEASGRNFNSFKENKLGSSHELSRIHGKSPLSMATRDL